MAATGNVAQTTQILYSTAILAKLAELKACGLKAYAERKTEQGGEKAIFYRIDESAAADNVPSMYSGDGNTNAGDISHYEAPISQISSQQKIKKVDMMKTKLDLKAPIINSMGNAVLNKEDAKILEAIHAQDAQLNKVGAAGTDIDDMAQIRALIMAVRSAHAMAQLTPDGKKGVALVIDKASYTKLSASEVFINGDYSGAFGGGTGDLPLTFFGAEIKITSQIPTAATGVNGVAYIIPSNTFGWAEWEGSEETTAEYHATDAQRWHLQIVKSVGPVIIEPKSITKFEFKKVTP